jgi:hypothetical protein
VGRPIRFAVALALVLGLSSAAAIADTASGTFSVHIRLDSSGLCISEALSQETNALVNVTCSRGQFVTIEPAPDKPFLGTHGGAFRFYFDAQDRLAMAPHQSFPSSGVGTITALRIYNADGQDGPLEMMVTF